MLVERQPLVAQIPDERDHDQSVEHRDAGQRDEADGGGNRERDVAEQQRHTPPVSASGTPLKMIAGIAQRAERHDQQADDQQQRQRHHDGQPPGRRLRDSDRCRRTRSSSPAAASTSLDHGLPGHPLTNDRDRARARWRS
jgi:hypothetical protein